MSGKTGEAQTGSVSTAVADLVRDAVQAAQPPPGTQPMVVVAGGGAHLPGLARVLATTLGYPVEVATEPRWHGLRAAVTVVESTTAGASTEPAGPVAGAPPVAAGSTTVRIPGVGPLELVAVGVPGLMSLVCFAQAAFEGHVEQPGTELAYLIFNRGEFGLACVFALLAAQGVVPWLDEVSARDGPAGVGALPRRLAGAILTAIGAAVMVGFIYAALLGVLFQFPISDFFPWAILPVLIPGVVMAGCAVLIVVGRPAPPGGWLRWLRFRPEAVACAAVGMGLVQVAATITPISGGVTTVSALGRGGGLLFGVSIGLAIATGWRARLLIAAPMGVFCALVARWNTTSWLAGLFIAVVTAWWVRRLWQLTGLSAVIDQASARRATRPGRPEPDRWGSR